MQEESGVLLARFVLGWAGHTANHEIHEIASLKDEEELKNLAAASCLCMVLSVIRQQERGNPCGCNNDSVW